MSTGLAGLPQCSCTDCFHTCILVLTVSTMLVHSHICILVLTDACTQSHIWSCSVSWLHADQTFVSIVFVFGLDIESSSLYCTIPCFRSCKGDDDG